MTDDGIEEFVGGIDQAHVEPLRGNDDDGDYEDYITNNHGEEFDPDIHLSDKDGNPRLTKHGKFRLKPGRKTGTDHSAKQRINRPNAANENISPEMSMAAETAASMYINSGVMLFGEEWIPDSAKREREHLVSAFEQYFIAKGIEDIPPGLALAIAMFGYAAPRLHMPQTQYRLSTFILWSRSKVLKVTQIFGFNRDASRYDTRSNGLRKNDASKKDSETRGWFWNRRART